MSFRRTSESESSTSNTLELSLIYHLPQQSIMSLPSGPSQTTAPSSNFKSTLDAALAEYKKKTGNDLLAHWLATELQTCESVDAVLDILRDQAKGFGKSGDQKLLGWIDPLVHVLHTFSDALGDGVSLVIITNPRFEVNSDVNSRRFLLRK